MAAHALPDRALGRPNLEVIGMRVQKKEPIILKKLTRPEPRSVPGEKTVKRQISELELNCDETLHKPRRVTEPPPSKTYANEPDDLRLDAERNFRLEIFRKPLANYIETTQRLDGIRRGITIKLRKTLIEEHLRCCDNMHMSTGARFLSVVYLERCLSLRQCSKTQGNLFSLACISIASKYHESFQENYDQSKILRTTANGCGISMDEVMNEERRALRILEYDLFQPTAIFFMNYYLEKINMSDEDEIVFEMAKYLAELFQLEYYYLNHLYSVVALVCLYVAANHFQNIKLCRRLRVLKDQGVKSDFDKCLRDIANCFITNRNRHVSKKYAHHGKARIDFQLAAD